MLHPKEKWEDIKDFEGLYQVSNYGNVRSLDRIIVRKDGLVKRYKSKIIQGRTINRKGYVTVNLWLNSKIYPKRLHTLVWDTFGNQPRGELTIDHIDEDKNNNAIWNLQLLTRQDNFYKSRLINRDRYTSNHIGVSLNRIGKWVVRGNFGNKINEHLGSFKTEQEAVSIYQRAKQGAYEYNP